MGIRVVILALLTGCTSPTSEAPASAGSEHTTLEAQTPLGEGSLFDLDVKLTTYGGKTFTLAEHRGHPVVISMFYATCPSACPMLINKVKLLENELGPKKSDVHVILVSFDPERDTVERLEKLAELHGVDRARWTLARADAHDVRTLAAVLGIKYRATPDGAINHSSVITALDREGKIAAQMQDLTVSPERVLAVLRNEPAL